MLEEIKEDITLRMHKAVESLKEKFKTLRTGRPTVALFEKIMVNYYGASTPLPQIASVNVPEARVVVIQAWDKTVLPEIEKAIRSSDLGVNPVNDGNLIRLVFPILSEERRKETLKQAKSLTEEVRVALRNIRRDANETIKKGKKDSLLSEDQEKKILDLVQKTTDDFIKKVDGLLAEKEKEILAH